MSESFEDMSDERIAYRVRMLTRSDIDHELVCVAARDRVLKLSKELREMERQRDAALATAAGGGWVLEAERPPESGKRVLVVSPSWREPVQFGVWYAELDEWRVAGTNHAETVTHWMEIKPPSA
jgi:hypothetical protein